jgi:hypothetical protein
MSGFAGSSPGRKQRREAFVSRRHSRSLKAECAGLVVGRAAFIGEIKIRPFISHRFRENIMDVSRFTLEIDY